VDVGGNNLQYIHGSKKQIFFLSNTLLLPDIEKEPLLLPDFKKYLPKYLKQTFTVQQFGDKISTKRQQEKYEYFYILLKE
jgi:hypothetical protein